MESSEGAKLPTWALVIAIALVVFYVVLTLCSSPERN